MPSEPNCSLAALWPACRQVWLQTGVALEVGDAVSLCLLLLAPCMSVMTNKYVCFFGDSFHS